MFTSDFKARYKYFAVCLIMLSVFSMVYLGLVKLENTNTQDYFNLRFAKVFENAQGYNSDKKLKIVAFGASDIALNLSLKEIFKNKQGLQLDEIDARNYGIIMGGSDLNLLVVEALVNNLEAQNKLLDLAIVGFRPMVHTKEYNRFMKKMGQGFRKEVSEHRPPVKFLDSPVAYVNFYLPSQVGYGQGFLANTIKDAINSDYFCKGCKIAYSMRARTFWSKLNSDFAGNPWDAEEFGGINLFKFPHEKWYSDYIEKYKEDLYYGVFDTHVKMYNHVDMNLSRQSLDEFNKIIVTLSKVSKRILVVYVDDIYRPGYRQLTSSGKARLKTQLEHLKADSSIQFINLSPEINFTDDDYIDLVHLTAKGKQIYNQALGNYILKNLMETKRYQ